MESKIKTILLDIEGTTTPINFVHKVLFPYARRCLEAFLRTRNDTGTIDTDVALLREEYSAEDSGSSLPTWDAGESPLEYLVWLMDHDRKSPALKSIQGKIWKEGYEAGVLAGEVFPDVPRAVAKWAQEGKRVAIYSSGSVLAQKLLFASIRTGDLTPYLSGYFDTGVGAKTEAQSYLSICEKLGNDTNEVLFISDLPRELDAARSVGIQVALSVRLGNAPVDREDFERVSDLFTY